ncbi:MAG: tetratricopeptide repeat protein [Planctomycetia bacterium]|nr:tetratricopeptide repeat protein [Planctomycetia bacterium]
MPRAPWTCFLALLACAACAVSLRAQPFELDREVAEAAADQDRGDCAAAESRLRAVVQALQATQATEERIAQALNLLASACHDGGKYREAEEFYREALRRLDGGGAGRSLARVRVLNNLGNLKCETADYPEAEQLLEDALALAAATAGRDRPQVATCWNNLGRLRLEQDRLDEAEEMYTQAHALLEKHFGPKHPHLTAARNNLAALYREQGKLAEAEALQRQVIEELK